MEERPEEIKASEILGFIYRFTDDYPEMIEAFTHGRCFWFAFILFHRFWWNDPTPVIMIDYVANHFGCKIDDSVYDVTGDVTHQYNWEVWDECEDTALASKIIRDCILMLEE